MASQFYVGDGSQAVWPVPFAYASIEELSVKVTDGEGRTTLMVCGQDYYIKDRAVVMALPAGAMLCIENAAAGPEYQGGDTDSRIEALSQQVANLTNLLLNQAAKPAARSDAVAVEAVADDRVAQLESKLAALENEHAVALAAARKAEEDGQIARLSQAGEDGLAAISEAAAEAAASASREIAAQADSSLNTMEATVDALNEEAARALEVAQEASQKADRALVLIEGAIGRLNTLTDELVARLGMEGETAGRSLEAARARAVDDVEAATSHARQCASARACLPGNAWPSGACISQGASLAAGSYLDMPIHYFPGRMSLLVSANGLALAPGIDFEEVVPDQDGMASRIRLLREFAAGTVWTFWVCPTNAGQAAIDAARHSRASADLAKGAAGEAQAAAREVAGVESTVRALGNDIDLAARSGLSQIRATANDGLDRLQTGFRRATQIMDNTAKNRRAMLEDVALAHVNQAEAWADNSRDWAANSEAHARCAKAQAKTGIDAAKASWRAAWTAQVAHNLPGIRAVKSVEELRHLTSGIYIINPQLHCSPSVFMGIWPVDSIEEMKWDGIFFIGPKYPDVPTPPPVPVPTAPDCPPEPVSPDDPDITVPPNTPSPEPNNSDWKPCNHEHGKGDGE